MIIAPAEIREAKLCRNIRGDSLRPLAVVGDEVEGHRHE
jgi:hypothetical protein